MIRCAVGVTLALIISTTLGYMIPHMTAIFALMFLSPGKKPMNLKTEIGIVAGLFVLGYFGSIFGKHLIDYPFVILPLLGLSIYWSYRLTKIPEPIRLLFLILIVLLPFVSLQANLLGSLVLKSMLWNLIIALVVTRVAFWVFPAVDLSDTADGEAKTTVPDIIDPDRAALNSLLAVFPLIALFYFFGVSSAVLALVFVIILSFDPFVYQSKKGLALLVANVLGGMAGVLVYNLLVIAPSYTIYIFLIATVAFYFAFNLYSGKKIAPIFKTSFNTFFAVMGVISTSTDGASSTVAERIMLIGLAILYVIVVFRIINTFNNPRMINA